MAERDNICNQLHMPAQSGSSTVLQRMRRDYTRESYMQLIQDAKSVILDVALSSDFITVFCDETDAEHDDTISLMNKIQYDIAYMLAYSMRQKTLAHRRYQDNVPNKVKSERLQEIINSFRSNVQLKNENA